MEHTPKKRVILSAIFMVWAILFFLYALLGAWVGTGNDALAGPSTRTDNIFSALWCAFAVVQLGAAIALHKHYRPWLFRVSAGCALVSAVMIFGPLLWLVFAG